MKFTVTFESKTPDRDLEVEADSPREAVRKAANDAGDGWRPIYVEAGSTVCHEVVDKCEGCDAHILDDEQYSCDEEGIYLCEKCAEGV